VTILLSVLITIIAVLAIKAIYTRIKTASRDIDQPDVSQDDCKMEGNPCYETTTFRQITTSVHQARTESHDYDRVFARNTRVDQLAINN
jgi:LPS O-antigen subunit length determinant protein (WzzB/FepE family)